jgi:hypothetical protein
MSNVGELFKFLGANETFDSFCKDSEKTNEQIIESCFQDEELATAMRNFVQDDTIIKNKMSILIGQKRKQKSKGESNSKSDENVPKPIEYKYKPIDITKVIYLEDFAYIEPVDHRMRLVTLDYELYY